MSLEFKKSLLQYCENYVSERISFLENLLKETQETANSDSKSSMGDKYETTRAMMHLEREKQMSQLAEVLKSKEILDRIKVHQATEIQLGSYIETKEWNYFLAISIGKITVEMKEVIVMSALAPLAKTFLSKKAGDEIVFNGKKTKIVAVY